MENYIQGLHYIGLCLLYNPAYRRVGRDSPSMYNPTYQRVGSDSLMNEIAQLK